MKQHFSAAATPYFYDQREAFALLRSRRWKSGYYCPRCASRHVREVRTVRILEAFSCNDCRYNFTTTADTFFHSSRIPVYLRLQLVAAFEFMESSSRKHRLGELLKLKQSTIQRQLSVLDGLPRVQFVFSSGQHLPFDEFDTVTAFLEQPSITFSSDAFGERVDQLLAPAGRPMRRLSEQHRQE